MKSGLLALILFVFTASTAAAEVTLMDNDKAVTIDCAKDPAVTIVGNHIQVTLTGTCTKVTATGNHATVTGSTTAAYVVGNHNGFTLDGVNSISVAGNHNVVSYKRALGKKPVGVKNSGKFNSIKQAK